MLDRRSFLWIAGASFVGACTKAETVKCGCGMPNGDAPKPASSNMSPSGAVPASATESKATSRIDGVPSPDDASLEAVEHRIGGRVGVFALDSGSGASLGRRADERFAMCSTFKWALVAAVLSRVDRGELALDEPVPYTEKDLLEYAPTTRARLGEGRLSIATLAEAAVVVSDNTAANLLLAKIGGPPGLTQCFRALGDGVTRLDRDEPMLNLNLAGDERDTTSPRAMVGLMKQVLAETVLSTASRERLIGWLVGCQTGAARLRAGFPAGWRIGDKTGTGKNGACNDVAVVWPPGASPWFVASYLSDSTASSSELEAAHAEIGRIVAARLARRGS